MVLASYELARRFGGTGLTGNAAGSGWVRTKIARRSRDGSPATGPLRWIGWAPQPSPEEGARGGRLLRYVQTEALVDGVAQPRGGAAAGGGAQGAEAAYTVRGDHRGDGTRAGGRDCTIVAVGRALGPTYCGTPAQHRAPAVAREEPLATRSRFPVWRGTNTGCTAFTATRRDEGEPRTAEVGSAE